MTVFVRAMARRRARETHAEGDVQPTPVGAIANADLDRYLLAESRVVGRFRRTGGPQSNRH
jgi:hypothetical protein